jgi:hypothetical protein
MTEIVELGGLAFMVWGADMRMAVALWGHMSGVGLTSVWYLNCRGTYLWTHSSTIHEWAFYLEMTCGSLKDEQTFMDKTEYNAT